MWELKSKIYSQRKLHDNNSEKIDIYIKNSFYTNFIILNASDYAFVEFIFILADTILRNSADIKFKFRHWPVPQR